MKWRIDFHLINIIIKYQMKHPLSLRPCLLSYFLLQEKSERKLKDDNITKV